MRVRLDSVSFRYPATDESAPVEALRGVSLEIASGEMVSLMGPSGSGKSTLLQLIGAIERPTSGEIFLGDRPTSRATEHDLTLLRRGSIGFVFQLFNLIPTLEVAENVAFPLELLGRPPAEIGARVAMLLDAVGLSLRARHYPNQLSGGEMQRVAIARAIAHRPGLILADEPTGNLDLRTGDQILDLLVRIHETERPTVVMATHSERAAARGGRVIRLLDGRIEER